MDSVRQLRKNNFIVASTDIHVGHTISNASDPKGGYRARRTLNGYNVTVAKSGCIVVVALQTSMSAIQSQVLAAGRRPQNLNYEQPNVGHPISTTDDDDYNVMMMMMK